ncbi:MAG: hypothetical protein WAL83_00810, partial [Arenicellales bacterium]
VDAYRSRYIHTCLRSGMLGNARREIINRLKQRPTHPKSYLQLLLTYLNRRLVVALFKVWDRMRADEVSIRHNREQERFRDIARELHRERASGKPDRLDTGRMEESPRAEDLTGFNHVDAYRSRYIHTCLRSGMLGNARREIINRLKERPTHPKSYLQLLLTYLNRRLVVAAFKVWDRVRGTEGV